MKQHKWHKEIKAWADGAEIECRYPDEKEYPEMQKWAVPSYVPWYDEDAEFRIKPQQQQPQYLYVYETGFNAIAIQLSLKDNLESYKCIGKIKLEVEE